MRSRDNSLQIEGALTIFALLLILFALFLVYRARMEAEPADAIDLNTATAPQLAAALDVPVGTANTLIAYRERIGGFDNNEQLLSVSAPASQGGERHRVPLLDPKQTRPLLSHFIVRHSTTVFRHLWLGMGLLAPAMFLLPPWLRSRGVSGDPFLLPIAFLLSGLGVAMLFSIKDPLRDHAVAEHHLMGIFLSLIVLVFTARLAPATRLRIKHYQYVWVIGAGVLVLGLLAFGTGPEGVKLDLFHFQPVEIIKLFLVFFLAGALADRADLLTDTSRRQIAAVKSDPAPKAPKLDLSGLLPRKQDIGPMAVMFACALTLFYVIKDLGPGLLLFSTFIAMLYLMTGRIRFLSVGILLILIGGVIGYWRHIGVFATRVDMWLHPFANTHPNGMQLGESYWGMASGGWQGSGLGLGMPGLIPRGGSDLAFASWAEETGLIGAWFLLILYTVLVWRGLRIALNAANTFDRALAFGLTSLFGLQTVLILGGVTGVLPLTGIALPFLSYGNSALVAAFVLLGLLRGISSRSSSRVEPLEAKPEVGQASRVFGMAFTLALLGVIGFWKLGQVQWLRADEIATRTVDTPDADKVTRPHINPRLLVLAGSIERGSIYDRKGRVLATSREAELRPYFSDPNVARRMAATHARYYPFGAATANLVGYLDPGVGGPEGFERAYNNELRGFARFTDLLDDYRRRNSFGYRPRRGLDLHLTIDAELQRDAQGILWHTASRLKDPETGKIKDRGGFVLMNPATGEVLVAATTPTFDPNTLTPEKMRQYTTGDDARLEHRLVDRSRFGFYPPGSTMKIATAACALDNMPDALNFTVTSNHVADPIRWQAGGKTKVRLHVREDEADPSFGALNMENALRVSSNIYFANLAANLGSVTFRNTLVDKMGFKHVPRQEAFDDDLPDIGYGQGRMLASPLEMCRLAASVANDGQMMTSRFVTALTPPIGVAASDLPDDKTDRPKQFPPVAFSQAMTRPTAHNLQRMMGIVVERGTARNIFTHMPFSVAGKTGSAQNHLYDKKAHSWFIGFAPYSADTHPRYAFACVIENAGYGRAAAAPTCRDVLKKLP